MNRLELCLPWPNSSFGMLHINAYAHTNCTLGINLSPIPVTDVSVDIRRADELLGRSTFGGWEDLVPPIVASEGVPADRKTILKYKIKGAC